MDEDLDKLRLFAAKLEQAYDTVEQRLRTDYPKNDPFEMKDMFGRFILLDALTSLVYAKSALLMNENFRDGE